MSEILLKQSTVINIGERTIIALSPILITEVYFSIIHRKLNIESRARRAKFAGDCAETGKTGFVE